MGNRGKVKKSFSERMMEKVPQYGNFGGPEYGHGEWVYDKAKQEYVWTKWADPIDGQWISGTPFTFVVYNPIAL